MVGSHQAMLDRNLAGDEVDQPPVHEVRADAAGAILEKIDAFLFDPWEAADARTDRATCAKLGRFVHVGETGVLDRLPSGIDPINDEWIDLALDLVIYPLGRVETIFMVGGLYLAGDA